MSYGLYLSAEGAHAQIERLEVISNNLANGDTVGFKRDLAIFQARYAEAIEEGQAIAGDGSLNDTGGGIMVRQTVTDFTPGPFKQTGLWSDVALKGDGFFAVEKEGQTFLTRAGDFRVTQSGELITQQGHMVLNESGGPITVRPENGEVTITPDGRILQAGSVQVLAIMMPDSLGDLVKAGENLFRPLADPKPMETGGRNVASGYLEVSDVKPTTEMVNMITASRAVEANIKMMQTQDQMLGGLFNRLMKS